MRHIERGCLTNNMHSLAEFKINVLEFWNRKCNGESEREREKDRENAHFTKLVRLICFETVFVFGHFEYVCVCVKFTDDRLIFTCENFPGHFFAPCNVWYIYNAFASADVLLLHFGINEHRSLVFWLQILVWVWFLQFIRYAVHLNGFLLRFTSLSYLINAFNIHLYVNTSRTQHSIAQHSAALHKQRKPCGILIDHEMNLKYD